MIQHHARLPGSHNSAHICLSKMYLTIFHVIQAKFRPVPTIFMAVIIKIQKWLILRMVKKMAVSATLLNHYHVPLCQTLLISVIMYPHNIGTWGDSIWWRSFVHTNQFTYKHLVTPQGYNKAIYMVKSINFWCFLST